MAVEKELAELKEEASVVIDELEDQLEMEQMKRMKESEKTKKALQEVEELSSKSKDEAIACLARKYSEALCTRRYNYG